MDDQMLIQEVKEIVLEQFTLGMEASAQGNVVRGGVLIDMAVAKAYDVEDLSSGDDELDYLVHTIIAFTNNANSLSEDAVVVYVHEIVPALMARIVAWATAQEF